MRQKHKQAMSVRSTRLRVYSGQDKLNFEHPTPLGADGGKARDVPAFAGSRFLSSLNVCLSKSNHASCSRPQGLASGHPPLTDCSHARDLVAVSFPSPVLELRATRRIAARSALFGLRLTSFFLDPFSRLFSDRIYKTSGQEIGQPGAALF